MAAFLCAPGPEFAHAPTPQVPDQWLATSPLLGHQYDGFSDIEGVKTSYRNPSTGVPVGKGWVRMEHTPVADAAARTMLV